MATLRQKRDGSYYTRTWGPTTWQITQEGVAYLRAQNITLGKTIPYHIIADLKQKNYVYNLGTGELPNPQQAYEPAHVPQTTPRGVAHKGLGKRRKHQPAAQSGNRPERLNHKGHTAPPVAVKPVVPRPARHAVRTSSPILDDTWTLRLTVTDQAWSLHLVFPELPIMVLKQLSEAEYQRLHGRAGFRYHNQPLLPLRQLIPGAGGLRVAASAQSEPYVVDPMGAWPQFMAPLQKRYAVAGLKEGGTLFSGDHGLRLEPAEPLLAGGHYYLLMRSAEQASTFRNLPPLVERSHLSAQDGWEAWSIKLPVATSTAIRQWAERIGHPLQRGFWQLRLQSPAPFAFSETGTPTLPAGSHALIAITPVLHGEVLPALPLEALYLGSNTKRQLVQQTVTPHNQETQYLLLPSLCAGSYQLWTTHHQPLLTFVVQKDQPLASPSPQPLGIDLQLGTQRWKLRAYSAVPAPDVLEIPRVQGQQEHVLRVHTPVPIDVALRLDDDQWVQLQASAAEAETLITAALAEWQPSTTPLCLDLDAGAFGRLTLRLQIVSAALRAGQQQPRLRQQARWLARFLVGSALHSTQPKCVITREALPALAFIAEVSDHPEISRVNEAPEFLMPHLRHLTQCLQHDHLKE